MTNSEIWMICLTAVIAVGGIIAACIFNNQLAVMQGQLTEMKTASRIAEESLVATQRPWVSVKLAIGPRGLFFDANGANLDLIFSLKNTGPTPAVTVRIVGSPRIDVGSNDRITELEKVCAEARQKPQNPKMFAGRRSKRKSSSDPIKRLASRFYRVDGSSNGRSHGWGVVADWPKIGKISPAPPSLMSDSHPSGLCSGEFVIIHNVIGRTLKA
jgi:hypothetical protein